MWITVSSRPQMFFWGVRARLVMLYTSTVNLSESAFQCGLLRYHRIGNWERNHGECRKCHRWLQWNVERGMARGSPSLTWVVASRRSLIFRVIKWSLCPEPTLAAKTLTTTWGEVLLNWLISQTVVNLPINTLYFIHWSSVSKSENQERAEGVVHTFNEWAEGKMC